MRGKVLLAEVFPFRSRITPAHAGKRIPLFAGFCVFEDHPRTCGEKYKRAIALTPDGRITPAHAGKSTSYIASRSEGEDHPRTCGEKPSVTIVLTLIKGSPPHMRGKDVKSRELKSVPRITPAHAGKRLFFDFLLI